MNDKKFPNKSKRSRGQVLVIFAVSLLALLFFVGLAVDAGIAYVTYGQLKRAVDSGAVAAANNFKRGATHAQMFAAVLETLKLHNMDADPSVLQLNVQICDQDQDGFRDDVRLAAEAPDFLPMCPITDPTDTVAASPRKLVWVEARQRAPFYFLSLLGFNSITLRTSATAEAAAIDLVIVLDTSESMAGGCKVNPSTGVCEPTPGYGPSTWADYDPVACNPVGDGLVTIATPSRCHPLAQAIEAARSVVGTLYEGYDQIGVVTFDSVAHVQLPLTPLYSGNAAKIKYDIGMTKLHDDAPYARMWSRWQASPGKVNAANPEDRDGDGKDKDNLLPCLMDTPDEINNRWDNEKNIPCDLEDKNDAFDWNKDGLYTDEDSTLGGQWLTNTGNTSFAIVSTCTGCGMRAASNMLKTSGRPGAVWVIIFLSDGAANMSDSYDSAGRDPTIIPAAFPNGFCTSRFWNDFCFDYDPTPRYCIDRNPSNPAVNPGTCPKVGALNATWESITTSNIHYSTYDYALDMTDEAALRVIKAPNVAMSAFYNENEPIGNDIAIYSIGLGPDVSYGESILRYMAAVGDDGDRVTDLCAGVTAKKSCGQYYFAPDGSALQDIFDEIASRIYTKITR